MNRSLFDPKPKRRRKAKWLPSPDDSWKKYFKSDPGIDVFICPYCKKKVKLDHCDVLGADQDCVYCGNCSKEVAL